MIDFDDKDIAIVALTIIAITVILATGKNGLDVITNIVCALGGFVTGNIMKKGG